MSKKKLLTLGLVGIIACSAVVPVSAQEVEKKKLVISSFLVDANMIEARKAYFEDAIREAFPDVEIEYKRYADQQVLPVEVAGGGGPDILDLAGPTDAAKYAEAGRILPLDTYAEQYGWQDIFYDWAYGSGMYDGHLYSLPNGFEGMGVWYNLDVFEENGWKLPETRTELEELMPKMQEAGIIPFAFGTADYKGAVDWLYSTFTSCYAGPDKIKAAMEGTGKYTDESIKNALQTMVDWWGEGWIGDKVSQSVTGVDATSFMATGRAAMYICGTWLLGDMTNLYPETNWKFGVLPAEDNIGEIFPLATAGAYAINANSENPDLAAEVLNYLYTSEDRHYASINEVGAQPYPLKSFDVNRLEGLSDAAMDMYQLQAEAMLENRIGYCAWTFYPSEMHSYMNDNTDGLFLEMITVDEFLDNAQSYLDVALENGDVPVLP